MATVKFTTFAKRRNSTKQPTSVTWDTRLNTYLKEATSQDRPVFKVTGNNFSYNYCEWDGKYYFIDEIESLINNEIAVHCVLDPLATYKADILASTQFVSYSTSATPDNYLTDTRMPVRRNVLVGKNTGSLSSLFNSNGFYVVTVIGKEGCTVYAMDLPTIKAMISEISNWQDNGVNYSVGKISTTTGSSTDFGDSISMLNDTLATIGEAMINSDFIGNAYSQAPSCIRSCIWVPFFPTDFLDTGADLYLGNFKCGSLHPYILKAKPVTGSVSVTIPWHFTGWRRAQCEEVYLYLPMVGMVNLASDSLANRSSITVKYSATATDGCVCYEVVAGDQVIGTYGGQCSANYPIGISQQASAGQIAQTAFAGIEKTINCAINSSVSPVSIAAATAGAALTGTEAVYNLADVALSRNNSCVGGVGGGAGSGLDLDIICYTVAHSTTIPEDVPVSDPNYSTIHPQYQNYVDTMGVPVMKSMSLSGLTGFCQCSNAHVEAPATAGELDAIDRYVNSGFYIE